MKFIGDTVKQNRAKYSRDEDVVIETLRTHYQSEIQVHQVTPLIKRISCTFVTGLVIFRTNDKSISFELFPVARIRFKLCVQLVFQMD